MYNVSAVSEESTMYTESHYKQLNIGQSTHPNLKFVVILNMFG